MNITKNQAILSLNPSLSFTLKDGVLSNAVVDEVLGTTALPTDAEITAEVTRLQAEYDAQEYARSRKPEYPDIGDQLDDLYHKGAFSDEMAVKIKAVKDANPKPE
jgi:hypothetical protein